MEKLNQWMMLAANLGVLAGIVFLAFEIQVNTNAVRTESAMTHMSLWIDTAERLAGIDEVNAHAIEKARKQEFAGMSFVERERLGGEVSLPLRKHELAFVQWRDDNLHDDLWEGDIAAMYIYLWREDWARSAWSTSSLPLYFGRQFRSHIDNMIADICSRKDCIPVPQRPPPDPTLIEGIEGFKAKLGAI